MCGFQSGANSPKTPLLKVIGCTLFVVLIGQILPGPALGQSLVNSPEQTELAQLQQSKLQWETSWLARLSPLLLPIALIFLGYVVNRRLAEVAAREADSARRADERFKVAQDSRAAEAHRFSALLEERTEAYARAFALLKPTALYFPASEENSTHEIGAPMLSREICREMGRGLTGWYFGSGGLLMSEDARNAYFTFLEWLGRAADCDIELASRIHGEGPSALTTSTVKKLRAEAGMDPDKGPAEDWVLGQLPESDSNGAKIKDYLAIQYFASRFRTALTEDIKSREPPGGAG